MSLSLNFEPHSWYMGWAIKHNDHRTLTLDGHVITNYWESYTDNGNTYTVDIINADTLAELKQKIRYYHVKVGNGYGERIKAKAGIK